MDIIKKVIYIACNIAFLFCVASLSVAGEKSNQISEKADFSTQIVNQDISIIVKENKRCIRCHKKERLIKGIKAINSVGSHESERFFNNCSACHGVKNNHPKEGTKMIVFSEHPIQSIQRQNDKCVNCHSPESISKIEWTHDVHYKDLLCSSCHNLHNDVDQMIDITPTDRILMCIDCHGI